MAFVISLVPDEEHVTVTQKKLEAFGFAPEAVSILHKPAAVWRQLGGHEKRSVVFRHIAIGALLGIVVGALYGVPAGIFNCAFMGCPQTLSVILWALITIFWVIGGGFLGAIIGLDKIEYDLYSYVEGVRRGEALFIVETSEDRAPEAIRILRQEHGTVIHDIHKE